LQLLPSLILRYRLGAEIPGHVAAERSGRPGTGYHRCIHSLLPIGRKTESSSWTLSPQRGIAQRRCGKRIEHRTRIRKLSLIDSRDHSPIDHAIEITRI